MVDVAVVVELLFHCCLPLLPLPSFLSPLTSLLPPFVYILLRDFLLLLGHHNRYRLCIPNLVVVLALTPFRVKGSYAIDLALLIRFLMGIMSVICWRFGVIAFPL